jgi:small subunit ribosomal protein S9
MTEKTGVIDEVKKTKTSSRPKKAEIRAEQISSNAKIKTVKKSNKIVLPKPSGNTIITRGGRKSSVASAMLWTDDKNPKDGFILVNDKDVLVYFSNIKKLITKIDKIFKVTGEQASKYKIRVTVKGGGKTGQADAVANSIAKALVLVDISTKTLLKKEGLLTRDSRAVQSKNTGQPKARKVEQFSKR